jgi:PIN domain nuclease of toxin-antitoxin system
LARYRDTRLSTDILIALNATRQRFLSAATAWELGLKQAAGKLHLRAPIGDLAGSFGLIELAVTIRHGDIAARLPVYHRDPFDRLLVAQAQDENLILVTADRRLAQYGTTVLMV